MNPLSAVAPNTVRIAGRLVERDALRYTPAKLAVVGFRVEHVSRQIEAEVERDVTCEIEACAVGPLASQMNAVPVGTQMVLEGFLAARSARNRKLVLHVRSIELLEGMNHGFQIE